MSQYIQHTKLPSGIHHYIWLSNSQDAMSECAKIYKKMNAEADPDSTILILVDLRQSGPLSVQQLSYRMKDTGIRSDVTYRTAYISDDRSVPILMKSFALINRVNSTQQFFGASQEEQAKEWLLNQQT